MTDLPSPLWGLLVRVVSHEHEKAVERISGFIDAATELSEQEICLATASLTHINRDAREHVNDLRALLTGSQDKHDLASVVIDHQTSYCRQLENALRQQVQLATKSWNLSNEISGFVNVIGRISDAARILTINGQIESARMGSQGLAFSVIANQMRDLSTEVRHASESIAELAQNLNELIPTLGSNATNLLRDAEGFSSQQASRIDDFQNAAHQERANIHSTLQATEIRANRIYDGTSDVIQHVQFQDRVARELATAKGSAQSLGVVLMEFLALVSQTQDPEKLTHEELQALWLVANSKVGGPEQRSQIKCNQANADIPDGGVLLF